ncbi:MAG: GerAB/ArcD/ProY family transporter [Clostridia bacterium]
MTTNNLIYKRQLAVLIFIMAFTFKVSRLPPLVAEHVKSSGALLIALYLVFEIIMFFIIYRIANANGLKDIEDGNGKNIMYKLLMLILLLNFLFKLCLMYAGTVLFVLELLFENISTEEIALILVIPIAYLSAKGIQTISRTAEISMWYIILVLVVNFLFLKASPDFSLNLPILNDEIPVFLKKGSVFFFWFGDFTPFIFLTLKDSKRNFIKVSLTASVLLILFVFLLMFAVYGNSARYISNFIVKVASFNQFANKLGRLDWTGMIAWLVLAILYLSVYLWAVIEAGSRIFKNRKAALSLGVIVLTLVIIIVGDLNKLIDFATTEFKYLAVFCNYLVPVILLFWSMQKRKAKAISGYENTLDKLGIVAKGELKNEQDP